MPKQYITKAKKIDEKYNINRYPIGEQVPVEKEIKQVYREAKGLVVGPFAEVSTNVDHLLDFIARHKSRRETEGMDAIPKLKMTNWIRTTNRQKLGQLIHREWAEILIAKATIIRNMNKH